MIIPGLWGDVPLLQRLARLGDNAYPSFMTVRGAAEALLAREGDNEEFERIVTELDDSA